MAPNGRVRPSWRKSDLVRFVILAILLTHEEADGASVKGTKSAENSARDDIFVRPDHGFNSEEAEQGREKAPDREKRLIPPNPKTKVVSMLFKKNKEVDANETKETVDDLTTTDIIIRLQEKYEHTICQSYLKSVPDLKNKYFQYDASLTSILNLTEDAEARRTFDRRYRLLQEPCNKTNELAFWREMFQVAEDDQTRILQPGLGNTQGQDPTPIPEDNFIHIPHPMAAMMERWHNVWLKYKDKSVCNQKLLLECIDPPSDQYRDLFLKGRTDPELGVCECRSREVGLSSVFPTGNIYNAEGKSRPFQIFVTYYYVNKRKVVNGEGVIVRGTGNEDFDVHNRCVVQANMSPDTGVERPMLITNPCDFSLPMIGMCAADCVYNASCVGATPAEKVDMQERAGKDWLERIRDRKVHSVFHHKCQCERDDDGKPKVCYLAGTNFFNDPSGSERSTIRPGSLALPTFSICLLSIFYTLVGM